MLHFDSLIRRYGERIVVVNLVDEEGVEGPICEALRSTVCPVPTFAHRTCQCRHSDCVESFAASSEVAVDRQ